MLLSDSYLTWLSVIKKIKKILYVSSPALWKKKKEKNPGFSPFSSSYLCAHRRPSLIHLLWRGGKAKQTENLLFLNININININIGHLRCQRTHRLLDDSLQATITPQSLSPAPSLSLSLSCLSPHPSVSLPVCLPLKSPPVYPLQIVTVPASQAHSHLIWSRAIGWRHRFSPSPETLLYTCYDQDHPCLCQDFVPLAYVWNWWTV